LSAELFSKMRHMAESVTYLTAEVERLSERVLALEAQREVGQLLDLDTLEPVKRRPGRPRKVDQSVNAEVGQ